MLCNAVGCPLEEKTITIEPKYVAMSETHVVIANSECVYYWYYRTKGQSIEQGKKKSSGKENAFHIDETPKPDGNYDYRTWDKLDNPT